MCICFCLYLVILKPGSHMSGKFSIVGDFNCLRRSQILPISEILSLVFYFPDASPIIADNRLNPHKSVKLRMIEKHRIGLSSGIFPTYENKD